MLKLRICLLSVACVGCTVSPFDGDTLQDTMFMEHRFQGLTAEATETVVVRDAVSGQIVAGGVSSNSNPFIDAIGATWYPWVLDFAIPRDSWRDNGVQAHAAFLTSAEGQPLYTPTALQWDCAITIQHLGMVQAALQCGWSTDATDVFAPCGVSIGGTCFDNPSTVELTDYPFDLGNGFTDDMQGVTHDADHWYFTAYDSDEGRLAKIHVSTDLDGPIPYQVVMNNRHFGDPTFRNGFIFISLEGGTIRQILKISSTDFTDQTIIDIPSSSSQQTGAFPWLAFNPKTNLFYSSEFNGVNKLYRYDVVGGQAIFMGETTLQNTYSRVQGGAFSASGRLYLSTDYYQTNNQGAGIRLLDFYYPDDTRATLVRNVNIHWDPTGLLPEELEGLTVWDLSSHPQAHPTLKNHGQVHLIMVDNDAPSNDDLYFKHVDVVPKSML